MKASLGISFLSRDLYTEKPAVERIKVHAIQREEPVECPCGGYDPPCLRTSKRECLTGAELKSEEV